MAERPPTAADWLREKLNARVMVPGDRGESVLSIDKSSVFMPSGPGGTFTVEPIQEYRPEIREPHLLPETTGTGYQHRWFSRFRITADGKVELRLVDDKDDEDIGDANLGQLFEDYGSIEVKLDGQDDGDKLTIAMPRQDWQPSMRYYFMPANAGTVKAWFTRNIGGERVDATLRLYEVTPERRAFANRVTPVYIRNLPGDRGLASVTYRSLSVDWLESDDGHSRTTQSFSVMIVSTGYDAVLQAALGLERAIAQEQRLVSIDGPSEDYTVDVDSGWYSAEYTLEISELG